MALTSFDELYTLLNAVVLRATGRRAWRKGGVQGQPKGPYATVFISGGEQLEHQPVTDVAVPVLPGGEELRQVPWGAGRLSVTVEFWRSGPNDTALHAATRFKQDLYLDERFWDVWTVAGLLGGVQVTDVSGMFRADIEPRAEVRFNVWANIALPAPLLDAISEIDSQQVNVIHVGLDDAETEFSVGVERAPVEESS